MLRELFDTIIEFFPYRPHLYLLVTLITLAIAYYYSHVVENPAFCCRKGKFHSFLQEHCKILQDQFKPFLWCYESRMQTVMGLYLRSFIPKLQYKREVLKLADGGEVFLDWLDEDSYSPSTPTILYLPGLTGNSQAEYLRVFCDQTRKLGYRCVVFNNRGTGDSKLLTPRTYSACNCEDLIEVVTHIKTKYPDSPLMGTGISMGSMILFHYLRQLGHNSRMVAAMLVSPIWNVYEGSKNSEQPVLNRLFNNHLAQGLIQLIKGNEQLFERHKDIDFERVSKCQTIREFDIEVTCKVFGYESIDQYYKDASLHDKLHLIKTPVLAISAGDDMYQPYAAIPQKEISESSHVAVLVTLRGGHIGFLDCLPFLQATYMERLFSQYVSAVFRHPEELAACFDAETTSNEEQVK